MNSILETVAMTGPSELSAGIDHAARSPLNNGALSGTHIEGLLAAAMVLIFMTVALLKPEWMG